MCQNKQLNARHSRQSGSVSCCKLLAKAVNWTSIAETIKDGRCQLWGDLLNIDLRDYLQVFDTGIDRDLFECEVFLCKLELI